MLEMPHVEDLAFSLQHVLDNYNSENYKDNEINISNETNKIEDLKNKDNKRNISEKMEYFKNKENENNNNIELHNACLNNNIKSIKFIYIILKRN